MWVVNNSLNWWIDHRLLEKMRETVPDPSSSFPSLSVEFFNQPNLAEHFSSATAMYLQQTTLPSLKEIGLTPSLLELYNSRGKWVSHKVLKEEREMNLCGKLDGVKNHTCLISPTTCRYISPWKTGNSFQKWHLQTQQQFLTMSFLLPTSYFFTPIIMDNLDPFSFSFNAVPVLIAFLPGLFPHERWLHYLWNTMNHFNKKSVASG